MENQSVSLLKQWNAKFNERQKLQHVYALIVIASFAVAAITSLISQTVGRAILYVTLFSLAALIVNAVLWALLYTNVVSGIKPVSTRRTQR